MHYLNECLSLHTDTARTYHHKLEQQKLQTVQPRIDQHATEDFLINVVSENVYSGISIEGCCGLERVRIEKWLIYTIE